MMAESLARVLLSICCFYEVEIRLNPKTEAAFLECLLMFSSFEMNSGKFSSFVLFLQERENMVITLR